MKLSSISLVGAAAIAAIVGGTIAAPLNVHAHDLEEVNPFERDLASIYRRESAVAVLVEREADGEPADDLIARHQEDHAVASVACLGAGSACHQAARDALNASSRQRSPDAQLQWLGTSTTNAEVAKMFYDKHFLHKQAANSPTKDNEFHRTALVDAHAAGIWKAHAEESSRLAKIASDHPK